MSTPYYNNKEDPMDNNKKGDEAEIYVTDAVPTNDEGPPVPAGHARFYCSSCHTVRGCWMKDSVGTGIGRMIFWESQWHAGTGYLYFCLRVRFNSLLLMLWLFLGFVRTMVAL
jgi:hypothetical protein